MSKRFDVCSPRPKKDGGVFWHRCGTAWQGEKGIQVVFDSLPLPDVEGRVSVSLFEPRDNNQQRSRPTKGQEGFVGGYDDVMADSSPF